jgi:uncharacterized membrane protein
MRPLMSLILPAEIIIGDSDWIVPALIITLLGVVLVLTLNWQRLAATGLATVLRVVGWILVSACLVNPLWSSARPRQGANVFAVVVDNSRSQNVATGNETTRSGQLQELLNRGEQLQPNGWLHRIDEHFELRRYTLSDFLQKSPSFSDISFDGASSRLTTGLSLLTDQYRGQPLAGVLLLTDGNRTDSTDGLDALKNSVPVYPVIDRNERLPPDLAIQSVTVSQSAFDDAPVTIQVQTRTSGIRGAVVRTTLLDNKDTPIETQSQPSIIDSPVRLNARPKSVGTVFYQVRTELRQNDGERIEEATSINNSRLIAVDRGSRPRRILYVSGRPNWEFKFLRRAIETDPQTELVGLIRIARKEAKFEFRRRGERSNSLFRGFDEAEQEVAEEYDQPVLVRLGTRDDDELISGFPKEAADLFAWDGLILDDIEAAFFTADQQELIREFVRTRGGGLLMLGGQESFRQGEYDRTPIGELLPVDLQKSADSATGPVRLQLTRDGWLQPWMRLRTDQTDETARLQEMPAFETLNPTLRVRPGAQVMATVADPKGREWPALIVQRFGRGRSAALCIGDLWRWRMHEGLMGTNESSSHPVADTTALSGEPEPGEDRSDYSRAARQMIRWLASDVPQRIVANSTPAPDEGVHARRISTTIRDKQFVPREDAVVTIRVTQPDGSVIEKRARPADNELGRYDVVVHTAAAGAWTCEVTAGLESSDGKQEKLKTQHGWAGQPDQEEMSSVSLNRKWLEAVAEKSDGRIVSYDELDAFVDELHISEAPVMETVSWPVWHQWSIFILAVACFVGDWTIRRRLGYP